jgi:hypothetical protein
MDKKLSRIEQIIQIEEEFRGILNQHILLRVRVAQKKVADRKVARLHSGGLVLIKDKKHNIRFGSVLFPDQLADLRPHLTIVERWNKTAPDLHVGEMLLSECLELEIANVQRSLDLIATQRAKVESGS